MSAQEGKVISLILSERFGDAVEIVGSHLFKNGSTPLLFIKRYTELSLSKVKEALCILIKYRLVSFKPNRNEHLANYKLNCENVLLMLRYPKYINQIKKKFGDNAEILMEELLLCGYGSASDLIVRTSTRLTKDQSKNVPLPDLRDMFCALALAKYVQRIPCCNEEELVPNLSIAPEKLYDTANLVDIRQLVQIQKGVHKVEESSDCKVYWTCNYDRFHQDMRDKLIETSMTKKFDEHVGEMFRVMLQQMYIRNDPWTDISNPIPILEIRDIIKKNNDHPYLSAFFDNYVSVVQDDSNQILSKIGDAAGGSYQIRIKHILNMLVWETIEQIVLEKFDTKGARIFRLVKSQSYIEPEQIQKLAMIPAKDAKKLTYQLLEENFLDVQELRKASQAGPNKSFTLFHIRLELVVRMVLELCYKSLYNTMTRRNHEKFVNKRLIDKKHRIDAISLTMRAQGVSEDQMADIEEMITPPERDILDAVEKAMKKLNAIELEIDDTIFLMKLFLMYE